MIDLFRHKFLGPLAAMWLVVTVVSVVIGAVAWSRFSANLDAAAQTEESIGLWQTLSHSRITTHFGADDFFKLQDDGFNVVADARKQLDIVRLINVVRAAGQRER